MRSYELGRREQVEAYRSKGAGGKDANDPLRTLSRNTVMDAIAMVMTAASVVDGEVGAQVWERVHEPTRNVLERHLVRSVNNEPRERFEVVATHGVDVDAAQKVNQERELLHRQVISSVTICLSRRQ